jgi:hypothetical protein
MQRKLSASRRTVPAKGKPFRRSDSLSVTSPHVVGGLAVVLVGLLWTIGVAILSVRLTDQRPVPPRKLFVDRAPTDIYLWPDDSKNPSLELLDCLPKQHENCLQRVDSYSAAQRIGILRSPSVLGQVMASFVMEYIKTQKSNDKLDIEVTSHVDTDHYFTKIVRIAVLPLHLEAIDLLLHTGRGVSQITIQDILDTVRLLIRWHCRLSVVAKDTALLTLTMDPSLAFPMRAESVLADFLGYAPAADDDASVNHIHSDPLAEEALHRIDLCRAVLIHLHGQQVDVLHMEELVDAVLQEEEGECQSTLSFSENNATDIIGHFLDKNSEFSTSICRLYASDKLPICALLIADGKK